MKWILLDNKELVYIIRSLSLLLQYNYTFKYLDYIIHNSLNLIIILNMCDISRSINSVMYDSNF